MAFISTPNCVRTDIQFLIDSQQVHNVIWAQRSANWTQAEREDLNDAIHTWWTGTAKSFFPPQIALTQINTVNQESDSAPSSLLVISPVEPGTSASTAVPNNVAACCTLRTALRGRSYRGRIYLAGNPTTDLQDQISWTTGALANFIVILQALNSAITALGAIWVVVSKFHNKVARVAGVPTAITAISVDSFVDSQRRRLGGRGV